MRVDVLGDLRVGDGAGSSPAVRGKPGELLRLLVAGQGRPVGIDVIIDVLWGERPPRSVTANLQTYASRVRSVLTCERRLAYGCGTYRLDLTAGECDLSRFVDLAAYGRTLRPGRAVQVLRAAVELWRGPPLTAAMRDRSVVAEGIACRFEEIRLRAYADLVDAACAAGEPESVVADLRQLVVEHPRREGVHGLLLRALYEAGEPAAALHAYHCLRHTLGAELGVEPGAELRRLYQAILRGHPVRSG
ncbi:AfsR/SARP family transcriptional regulator [Paractinoplanes atraurantiacus]|uniref:DNA-binding transcriptional activator of the SARP family n=1 Tax=Paractinoplanes atraurantiacus TaxID=1036182 RepID=A0A285IWQ8_9ACTN|nr:BTAD domain-containing putative transcriptional regulator [Actinoplanes atraurantiacus]SNY52480.1 DNA-binding transcriptional activator of the SARP family [Actinoplanes atraurantiacus]